LIRYLRVKWKKIRLYSTDSFFINFNYTTTLEDLYAIPRNHILYIHGGKDENDYILGHGKSESDFRIEVDNTLSEPPTELDLDSCEKWYEDQSDMFIEQAIHATIQNLARMKKDVLGIIQQNSDLFTSFKSVAYVHIYGKTFSSIDLPYLQRIASTVGASVKWEISYFSDNAKRVLMTSFRAKI
jgi:hypothetical protein